MPGGAFAIIAPFLLLGAVSLVLLLNWQSIPARFPTHWDIDGRANGWSVRSPLGVFGPVLIAFGVLSLIAGMMVVQGFIAEPAPPGSALERKNRTLQTIPLIVMWIVAGTVSPVALTPLILSNGKFPIPLPVMMLIPIGGVAAALWVAARAKLAAGGPTVDGAPDEFWKWGQIYYNPADPSIMVEKRIGIGYTFNFARWQSWLLTAGIVAVPVAIVFLVRRFAR